MLKYLIEYLREFWHITTMMAPWLLFGFFAAGILSIFFSPAYVRRHLGGKGLWPIVKAALLGVPLPLCSCGVIPVAAALKKQGARNGAVGSFLISTPQTGADSIIVTWSMLGWVFAVFKPVVAFITGIIGGALLDKADATPEETTEGECEKSCCASEKNPSCSSCDDEAAEDEVGCPACSALHYGFVTLLGDIALSLLVGLLIAALISLAVPADFGAQRLSSDWLAFPAMLLFGIPLYVCSTASVPIAAALIAKGISPGAALVFLITGPATNVATITAMGKVLGKKAMGIYLSTVAVTAVIAGIVLNQLTAALPPGAAAPGHVGHPGVLNNLLAGLLLALIAWSLLKKLIPVKRGSN